MPVLTEHRFSVQAYYRMAETGGLPRDARVELLNGRVIDSTLTYDRQEKLPAYGRSGIAEVWMVNLDDSAIEVYRDPHVTGYGSKKVFAAGSQAPPAGVSRRSNHRVGNAERVTRHSPTPFCPYRPIFQGDHGPQLKSAVMRDRAVHGMARPLWIAYTGSALCSK